MFSNTAKRKVCRKKAFRQTKKYVFDAKKCLQDHSDVLMTLADALTVPEEMPHNDDNSRMGRITKNVAKAVKFHDMLYRKLHPDETHEQKKRVVEEIHSVFFYCLLKNNGIECEEADDYYEVLDELFPQLDLNIYLSIILTCHWSELFAKCVNQLPDNVAAAVLKLVLTEVSSKTYQNDFILYHGIIQALMLKMFEGQNLSAEYEYMMFQFPFQIPKNSDIEIQQSSLNDEQNGNTDHNNVSFVDVLGLMLDLMKKCNDNKKVVAILLNGMITAFNSFLKCETPDTKVIFVGLERYSLFMEQCLQSEGILNALKTECESFQFFSFVQAFTMEEKYHWSSGYLLLLVQEDWQAIKGMVDCDKDNETFHVLDRCIETLHSVHPLLSGKESLKKSILDEYVRLCISLVKNELDGKKTAFDFLSEDIDFLKRAEVQSCLAKDIHLFSENEKYLKLMAAVFSSSGPEKEKLFHMFLNWYRGASSDLKEEILQSCLLEHGLSSFIKSPEFETEFNIFLNTVVDLQEAVFFLKQFCMQSPQEVLERIIAKVVDDGPTSLAPIQALKSVSCVCSYQRTPACLPLLVEILKSLLVNETLSHLQRHNMSVLIKELMKVFPSGTAFSRYHFVMHCIIPNFSSNSPLDIMEFAAYLLNFVLSDSLDTGSVSWFANIHPLPFMLLICSLLNYCFFHKDAEFKADMVSILGLLRQLHNKFQILEKLQTEESSQKKLKQHLQTLGNKSLVELYVLDFINGPYIDVSSLSLDLLLFWCIAQDHDSSQIDDSVLKRLVETETASLVEALSNDLVILTIDESISLFGVLMKLDSSSSENSEGNEGEELNTSKDQHQLLHVIKIFVDAFILLKTNEPMEDMQHHPISAFIRIVHDYGTLICSSMRTFEEVFFMICTLASKFDKQCGFLCLSLVTLKNALETSKSGIKLSETFREKLQVALESVPDCSAKQELLEHFMK